MTLNNNKKKMDHYSNVKMYSTNKHFITGFLCSQPKEDNNLTYILTQKMLSTLLLNRKIHIMNCYGKQKLWLKKR